MNFTEDEWFCLFIFLCLLVIALFASGGPFHADYLRWFEILDTLGGPI